MSTPMTPEELQACRERAEAATAGALSVAREDEEHGAITYAVVRGGLTLAFVPEDTRGKWEKSSAKADAAFWASARADVLRLLATIAARDEDIRRIAEALGRMHEADGHAPFPASADELVRRAGELTRAEEERGDALAALDGHRFSALMAYGVRGGPGAWRWASDPEGTILDTEAAWERMLGEMRAAHAKGVCAAGGMPCDDCDENAPAERKPVAGWVNESPGMTRLVLCGLACSTLQHFVRDGVFEEYSWRVDGHGILNPVRTGVSIGSLEAAQLAAEDALFAIADAINALRGGR